MVTPEPPKGSIMKDAAERRWKKVRVLGPELWSRSVCNANLAMRIGTLTDDHVIAMGYKLCP
jgi:hypothetical protein